MISDDSGMAMVGVDFFRETGFHSCGDAGEGSAEVTSGTPNPRRSGTRGIAAGGDMAQVEDLIKPDKSVSSVENLQRSLQFGGLDPFLTALKLSSKSSRKFHNKRNVAGVVR